MHLTVIILTYNEAKHIVQCVESVKFADAVLVFDSYSTDETVMLAQQAGAEVIQNTFAHYAQQRNAALDAVAHRTDWVLFVDADERISATLAAEIRMVIADGQNAGYRIPRYNIIIGHQMQGAGWYPDYQTRLLRVDKAHYDPDIQVHEVVLLDGPQGTLKHHIVHYNYDNWAQFHAKQSKYTAYEAQIMRQQGTRPKPQNYILQPLRHFRWRFMELDGYRDGWHGLRLCGWMAWYEFRKYVMLRKLWQS